MATSHFKQTYKAPTNVSLAEIFRVAQLFPPFVDQEEALDLVKEVSMEELEASLKCFKRDKSPRLDGWTVEFFLAFFETLSPDLLKVVEASRSESKMLEAFNSTFVALIPKSANPASFDDFQPISLCNCIYKIISKIIANRLRPILSSHISPKQFSFL